MKNRMRPWNKTLWLMIVLPLVGVFGLGAQSLQQRQDILRFGLENEVRTLLTTLTSERNSDFHGDLLELLPRSSPALQEALFRFFLEMKWEGAKVRALELLPQAGRLANSLALTLLSYIAEFKWPETQAPLMELVRGSNKPIAVAAARSLGRQGFTEAAPELLTLLVDPEFDANLKNDLIWALGELKDSQAFGDLAVLLEDSATSPLQKRVIVEALAKIAHPETEGLLQPLLSDENIPLRAEAVKTLLRLPGTGPETALAALRDNNAPVRLAAAEALAFRSWPETAAMLAYRVRQDPEPRVRTASARALITLGGHSEELMTLVREKKLDGETWRYLVGEMVREPGWADLLLQVLDSESNPRTSPYGLWVGQQLMKPEEPQTAAPLVRRLLRWPQAPVQAQAFSWVERFGDSSWRPEVLTLQRSAEGALRTRVQRWLTDHPESANP